MLPSSSVFNMKPILMRSFIAAILMVFSFTPTSLAGIFDECGSANNHRKWEDKVTIDGKETFRQLPIDESTKEAPNHPHGAASNGSRNSSSGIFQTIRQSMTWFWSLPYTIATNIVKVPSKIINIVLGTTSKVARRIFRLVDAVFKKVCSVIPEPMSLPNVNFQRIMKFKAYDGRISGLRGICERRKYLPQLVRRGYRVGLRHKLDLGGLHFQYRIIDDHLQINRTFNWTLSNGSGAEMDIVTGYSLPCVLRIENVDVNMKFEGDHTNRKTSTDSESIWEKMRCYLYYGSVQAIKTAMEPLKYAATNMLCISLKEASEQGT